MKGNGWVLTIKGIHHQCVELMHIEVVYRSGVGGQR